MLETSVNLSRSHWYKEKFLEILNCNDRETVKEKMQEWIYNASNCSIPQFEKWSRKNCQAFLLFFRYCEGVVFSCFLNICVKYVVVQKPKFSDICVIDISL